MYVPSNDCSFVYPWVRRFMMTMMYVVVRT